MSYLRATFSSMTAVTIVRKKERHCRREVDHLFSNSPAPTMREAEATRNGKAGSMVYKYPPTAGTGHEAIAEKAVIRDMIFACAKGSASLTVLNMSTGIIEKTARNRILSNTTDTTAGNMDSLGAVVSTTRPRKPHI